jgi:hypothetical protein
MGSGEALATNAAEAKRAAAKSLQCMAENETGRRNEEKKKTGNQDV